MPLASTIGNQANFPVDKLHYDAASDQVISELATIDRVAPVNADDVATALENINMSRRIIHSRDGLPLEIAETNPGASTTVLHNSTYTSSLQNPGNAAHLAISGAEGLNQDVNRVYATSPGNGGTVYFSSQERKRIAKGRATDEDGELLPTIAGMGEALSDAGVHPTLLTADSAGTLVNRGLMQWLPQGQVEAVFEKGSPGMRTLRLAHLAAHMLVTENVFNSRQHSRETLDPDAITPELEAATKERLPNIFNSLSGNAMIAVAQSVRPNSKATKLLTDLRGFSKGPSNGNPGVEETLRALYRQPDAKITYHAPLGDIFVGGNDVAIRAFLGHVATQLVAAGLSPANHEALLVPGTHNDHARYPTLRRSTEHYAFTR
jgi:hypothetical protein